MGNFRATEAYISTLPERARELIINQRKTINVLKAGFLSLEAERDKLEITVRNLSMELDKARSQLAERKSHG